MASRHDIISITFQANAGKANVALQSLQAESKKSSDRVKELKKQLEDGLRANLPADQITKIRENIKAAEKDVRQWNSAYKDLTKGVRTLDEAIKQFNAGTLSKMSAAFNKAAVNAAKLAQTKMTPGTKEWKEMDALIVEAQSNVLKATTDVNGLVAAIKKGGATSKSTLTQAKSDLEQLLTLEVRGSAEWNTYNKQLKVVQGELNKIAEAERKAAQADQTAIMSKRMKDLKTLSSEALAETKRYWESMIAGAEKGSAEMAKYEANLKKVVIQERQRKGAGAEQVLGNMKGYGIEQVRQATQEMERLRDSVVKGSRDWLHWSKMVNEGNAYLAKFDEEAKIARGDAMSLSDALKLSSTAGGKGFQGTATQLQQAEQALQKASAAAKKGSPDWIKYQEALAKVRVEMNNAGMTSERMSEILSKPTNAKNLNELQAAVKRSKAELDLMAGTIGKNSAAYTQLAEQTKKAEIQLKALQSQSHGTASSFEKAWSRLKTYIGLYVGAAVAMQKIVATMGDLMELSDKMGEVRKTTGFTANEVGRLSTNLAKLDVRTSLTSLMELSSLAGSVGLKTLQDVQGFTEAANQLLIALPEMGNESARTLIKIAQATGDLQKNNNDVRETLEKVGSTIIALRANSASAAGPITDFVSRVGAVGAQSGISIDQIAALGSTIDALGGRVEMSATALSRMIPAIRNNSFAVANSIGVTESYLRSLSAMDQMVLIFQKLRDSIKGINTETEEGQQQMADNIEAVLGKNAVMAEVMKDLNQQGARAGIVFGLLSQNVDELQKQLGIAGKAYSDNTALMDEFNKMNDTTAAKWERLKNQLEEMFVSDSMQRFLGWIIDRLRDLVDLISMDGPLGSAIRFLIVSATLFRVKWLEAIGEALMAFGNWILAQTQATAATTAETAATAANTAAKTANAAATTAVAAATEGAAVKTNIFTAAWGKMDKAMKANIIGLVAAALIWLGTSLYNSARRAREASKQIDVLAEAEKKAKEESVKERAELEKLYKVTQDQTNSMEERKKALRDMVGDEKYKQYYENLSSESELATAAASAYKELSEQILATARARALDAKAEELQRKRIELEDQKTEKQEWEDENRENYRKNRQAYEAQKKYAAEATRGAAGFAEAGIAQRGAAAMKPGIIDEFEGSIRERNRIDKEIAQIDKDIERLKKQVDTIKPKAAESGNGTGSTGGTGGTGGGSNLYGGYNKVTSDYEEWDADALVARRKEMLERVRALGNGADVQAVLSQDGRFISEAVKNNIKTTKQAIEWYNKERLKIQEELHTRHLTNSGDWMDAGGNKGGKKKKFDESSYALAELERYYALRKQRIEDARIEENFSEAEFNRRMEILEQEHLKKRSDLRNSFTSEDAAFVAKFRKWWESVAELDEIEWNKVENEWVKATARNIGHNNMMVEKDLAQMKAIVMKQMNAIEEILAQERPFDGITKNLQDNLIKIGILFKDGEQPVEETTKRLSFLLGEAESAYSLTTDELMQKMRENGMGSWADSIASDENADKLLQAMLAQLRTVYDKVQEAIKKEAAQIKKEVDIWWSDIATGEKQSRKDTFEKALSNLGLWEDGVKRANSLIGAGVASERVADKLAIKQMQIRLAMQATYFAKMREVGELEIQRLQEAGKLQDAEHLRKSLNLALTQEQVKLDEQRVAIANKLEESQNRLYTQMHEYADLLYSSMQSLFEASNTGNAEFYNERAKLQLTGGDGSAKQYIVIDNAGTEDAEAHYEYLTEMEALERQHEIDQQNASAEAWRKVMDDVNAKINEMITDQMNAMLQDAAINDNTAATNANTEALIALTNSIGGGKDGDMPGIDTTFGSGLNLGDIMSGSDNGSGSDKDKKLKPSIEIGPLNRLDYDDYDTPSQGPGDDWAAWRIEQNNAYTENAIENAGKRQEAETKADKKMAATAQSAFAKMTQAANLYGIAYQVMSNDNMTAAQKFGMIAVQAAGNAAITALTVNMSETTAQTASDTPSVFSKLWKQLGWGAIPVFALFTGLLGGLMGLAASAITKSKSQIAQATGVSASQGRLATGMLTYAEGNVNEFTDPGSLTPGRHYNVDAADGKSYRAKYMGTNPKTHITNGPEFHLAGEAGREAIIDAHTTRLMQMDDNGIWSAIQTLYNGGSLRHSSRRGRGVRAFASGNLEEFEAMDNEQGTMDNGMDIAAMTDALNRQTAVQEALLERLSSPIQATFNVYGKGGLVDSYDTGKKTVNRHGVKY